MMFGIYATQPRSRKYQWLIVLACLGDSIVRVVSLGFLGTRWRWMLTAKPSRLISPKQSASVTLL